MRFAISSTIEGNRLSTSCAKVSTLPFKNNKRKQVEMINCKKDFMALRYVFSNSQMRCMVCFAPCLLNFAQKYLK